MVCSNILTDLSDCLADVCPFTCSTQVEAEALRNREDFRSLDTSLQGFILAYSAGETKLENLISGLGQQLSTEISKIQVEANRARLLQSLKFSGMNERRNAITSHHEETYQWVFGAGTPPSPSAEIVER
jgi:hypothetical protein